MTWTKLSDDYSDDCWTLSDPAWRLHAEGLIWSNRKLLDCRIPKDDLRHMKCPEAVVELLATGWWAEAGDVYVIRHHAAYQRTREAVVKQQEVNQQNGRKGGRPAKPTRIPATRETESLTESLTESETERDRPGLDRTAPRASTDETELDLVAKAKASWGIPTPEPEPDDHDRALSVLTSAFPAATIVGRTA